jgi:hypothetical protein
MSGRDTAADDSDRDAGWDAPAAGRATTDEDAGGAPWDRPGEERFAPPPPRDVHWAFRAPDADETAAWPAADDRFGSPAQDEEPAWDADVDAGRRSVDGPWSWEDAGSLVTAGGGPRTDVPRDPAQPGLFDPYDAFAPVVADDGWTLPPRFPEATTAPTVSPDPGRASAPAPRDPLPGVRRSARESVFGDMFAPAVAPDATESEDRSQATVVLNDRGAEAAPEGVPVDASPLSLATEDASPRPDPREWPPIPNGLLPPIPQPAASAQSATSAEPDGRRFAWPPPQPRISSVPRAAADDKLPVRASDQRTLWSRESDPLNGESGSPAAQSDEEDRSDDVSGSALASTASERSGGAMFAATSVTLKAVAVVAVTAAALVLVAQFVLSFAR